MDKLNKYRQIIKSILQEYARLFNNQPAGVDVVAICDENSDAYTIMNVGWEGKQRMDSLSVFMRIRGGKIWVEDDWTMYGFVDELLEAGVPKEDIVLGFHPPKMRQYTEFAVA